MDVVREELLTFAVINEFIYADEVDRFSAALGYGYRFRLFAFYVKYFFLYRRYSDLRGHFCRAQDGTPTPALFLRTYQMDLLTNLFESAYFVFVRKYIHASASKKKQHSLLDEEDSHCWC